jgi:hypothetical protein
MHVYMLQDAGAHTHTHKRIQSHACALKRMSVCRHTCYTICAHIDTHARVSKARMHARIHAHEQRLWRISIPETHTYIHTYIHTEVVKSLEAFDAKKEEEKVEAVRKRISV